MSNKTILTASLLVAFSLLFFSCKKKKEVAVENSNPTVKKEEVKVESTASDITVLPVNINPDYNWAGSTDAFDILSTEVSGDMLIVEVQYGGGCKDHSFNMNTNLMWMKSMPPQLNLYLEHEDNDDNCRALITRKLAFDMSTCRYQNGTTVVLIINGNREKSARYQY
jgi:hypothetical protein